VGVLRPATPPPDFDLDLALRSLQRFAARRPAGLALAHYGVTPGDPIDLLAEAAATLRGWAAVAEAAFRDGRDIAAALDEAFAHELDAVDPAAREIGETLNGVHANAAGFRRWLQKRSGPAATSGAPGPTATSDDGGPAPVPPPGDDHHHPHPHPHPHPH
jgi:hypothetical protein